MASSSSNAQRRPEKLARHNSSFLGTIKSIVSKPLQWFGQEDGSAAGDKRRRSTEPAEDVDQKPAVADERDDVDMDTRGQKRMRLDSPSEMGVRQPVQMPRASSAFVPLRTRNTLSPRRQGSYRTMSIDPPQRLAPQGAFNFASVHLAVDGVRDASIPPSPLSPRPSFRMRSSLTPQPTLPPSRHFSEPPPLNQLVSNPMFLHPPQAPHQPAVRTLGTLVENARSTRSSSRQPHSSLLFAPPKAEQKDVPAERALHQLEIYKTPLVPTRLRATTGNAVSGTTDMFKPRRSGKLILMNEEDKASAKAASKNAHVKDTKPYAGAGGMKKLLARRKLETVDESSPLREQTVQTDDAMDESSRQSSPPPPTVPEPSKAQPSQDWYSAAAGTSSSTGSSLRVGRTKVSRNHIDRPNRKKFSAAFEEEGDDAMDGENLAQKRETKLLDDAAKKAPVFSIPPDFSFAKEAPPIQPVDPEDAKEMPISSLPFSFAKPKTAAAPVPAAEPSPAPNPAPVAKVDIFSPPQEAMEQTRAAPPAIVLSARLPTPPPPSKVGGIPNFFASSLAKAPEIKVPAPSFGDLTPKTPTAAFSFAITPATPIEAPKINVPEPVQESKPAPSPAPFSFGPPSSAPVADKPATSLFGTGPSTAPAAAPTASPFSFAPSSSSSTAAKPFSFGEHAKEEALRANEFAPSMFGPSSSSTSSTLFGEVVKTPASLFGEAPKPSSPFVQPVVPPQSTPSPLPFTFALPSSSTSAPGAALSTAPSGTTSSSMDPFAFKPAAAPETKIETPKPVFGSTPAFNFGQPQPQPSTEPKPSSPFAFGVTSTPPATTESKPAAPFSFGPSTPTPSEPKPAAPFSFGPSATTTTTPISPAPIGFSFSSGSTTADVSKSLFNFHGTAPTERPVTPPKNVDQEVRMEESPTRQTNGNSKPSNFSFNSGPSSGSSLFGNTTSSSSGPAFGFGSSSAASSSNPFAPKEPVAESKPFPFGNGAAAPPQISTSFSFGNKEEPTPSPAAGGFGFSVQTPTSTTAPASAPFSFGPSTSSNPFGQPPAASSAPGSPSTFAQNTFGGFNTTAPTAPTFTFGASQPASPATGAASLPSTGGFGAGGGFGVPAPQPSSPFSAPQPLAPSTSNNPLFTIGAAPQQGNRVIKKLPNRRATGKR